MVETVHKFINELAVSYVNSVLNSILFTAQNTIGFAAGFKNIRFYMLFHNKFNLFQQGIQMLRSRGSFVSFFYTVKRIVNFPMLSTSFKHHKIANTHKNNTNMLPDILKLNK